MRTMALFDSSKRMEIGLRLSKAEMVVGSTSNHFSIVFILTVIMPKTDLTDFVLPAPTKSFEFAAWASVRRRQFLGRDDVLEGLA